MADARLQVIIDAADRTGKAFSSLKEHLGGIQHELKIAGAVVSGFGAAGALAIKTFSDQALEGRAAHAQLRVAIQNTGESFTDLQPKVEALTAALQRQTNFAKTEQTRALSLMVSTLGDVNLAMAALPAAMEIAAATGSDLTTTSIQLSRVLAGEQEAIRGVGIDFGKASDAAGKLALVQSQLGGTAAATMNPFKQLGNSIQDLKEAMGEALLPILKPIISAIRALVEIIQQLPTPVLNVAAGFLAIVTALALIGGPLLLLAGSLRTLMTLFSGLVVVLGAVQVAMLEVLVPVLLAVLAVEAMTRAFNLLPLKDVPTLFDEIGNAFTALKEKTNELVGGIVPLTSSMAQFSAATVATSGSLKELKEQAAQSVNVMFPLASAVEALMEKVESQPSKMRDFNRSVQEVADAYVALGRSVREAFPLEEIDRMVAAGFTVAEAAQLQLIRATRTLNADLERMAARLKGGTQALEDMRQAGFTLAQMFTALNLLELRDDLRAVGHEFEETTEDIKAQAEALKAASAAMKEFQAVSASAALNQLIAQFGFAKGTAIVAAGAAGAPPVGLPGASVENIIAAAIATGRRVSEVRDWFKQAFVPVPSDDELRAAAEAAGIPFRHGGIVMKPTVALLGEAGPEAVVPLRQGGGGGQFAIRNIIVLDGRVLAEWQGKAAENEEQVRSS